MKEIKQRWYLSSIYEPNENEVVLCLVNNETPVICVYINHQYYATDNSTFRITADMSREPIDVTCWCRIPKYVFG